MAIILASASPRRRELLEQLGFRYRVVTRDVNEDNSRDIPPEQLVVLHARQKAYSVRDRVDENDTIIGADTIVVLDGKVFGKPSDVNDARRMLTCLSGRMHKVITGIAVLSKDKLFTDYTVTEVEMAVLEDAEIERYIACGEPMDKAGAYAIQGKGAVFVEGIHGCYSNVVGLPLRKLAKLLEKAGVSV